MSKMYFCYFDIISLWKRAYFYIWKDMSSILTRMFCAKSGSNWPNGSEEDLSMFFLRFCCYLPLKIARSFIWKIKRLPFPGRCVVSSLVEICPVVLRKRTLTYKCFPMDRQRDMRTDRQMDDRQQAIKQAQLSLKVKPLNHYMKSW